MKEFLSCEEQIKLLKNRGLIIEDEETALSILKIENYYNVINGYKELFVEKVDGKEKFIDGVTFEEIYSLYSFDKQIRDVLFQNILKVENHLRSLISYEFSKEYGNDNYLKFSNFDTLSGDLTVPEYKLEERAKFIHELLAGVQQDIASSISKNEYIKHYVVQYGFVPMWVLVNSLSLGRLSKFYSLMKQKERIKVASHWDIKEDDLSQYIKVLAHYRNLCAHDERIYNARTGKSKSIPDTIYHEKLNIPKENDRYIYGKTDLYSLVIVLKILLSDEEFNSFYSKLDGRVHSINSKIKSIDIHQIYREMGFPNNWYIIRKS